jgi:M6 family metalloprotease-like protein
MIPSSCYILIFLVLLSSSVKAFIPPHPESNLVVNKTWVPVDQHRRNLGIEYGYQPTLLNEELCRNEDEAVCQEMDEAMQLQARRSLQLVQQTGVLKILVIPVQFRDHDPRELITRDDIEYLFNGEGRLQDIAPTGSIRSYLRLNSYNNLQVEATVVDWTLSPMTEKECSFGNSGLDQKLQECFWPALDQLDTRHANPDDPFTWGDYDMNYDNFIDNVVFLHSGYGAEYGETDADGTASISRIWSHAVGAQRKTSRWQSRNFLIDLGSYSVTSVYRGIMNENIARIGIMAHELLHTLGIPDLYDKGRADLGGGTGKFSIMSSPWGQGGNPTYPGHLDPWSKMRMGWLTPIPIAYDGEYSAEPSETNADVYIIREGFPDGEFLLIENRQALHYDALIWGQEDGAKGGVVIWHIDNLVFGNRFAGGKYQDGWPANGNHYQVAVVQADGDFDLEQNLNGGDADDFFGPGKSIGPGETGNVFSPGSSIGPGETRNFPNTDSYQGGNVEKTNIRISDFNKQALTMSFRVDGLGPAPSEGGQEERAPPVSGINTVVPVVERRCLVRVNVELCDAAVADNPIAPQADCECLNYCGNGVQQLCCPFGEACAINCRAGGLIGGCVRPQQSSPFDPGRAPALPGWNDGRVYQEGDAKVNPNDGDSEVGEAGAISRVDPESPDDLTVEDEQDSNLVESSDSTPKAVSILISLAAAAGAIIWV